MKRKGMSSEYSHPETQSQQEPWHVERPHFPFQVTDQDLSNPNLTFLLLRINEYYSHILEAGLCQTD